MNHVSKAEYNTQGTIASNVKDVVTWNLVRNNLHLDEQLEEDMLSEELNEFFVAETIEDHLDAYADFRYVMEGTTAKFLGSGVPDRDSLAWWSRVKTWGQASIDYMDGIIREHFFTTYSGMTEEIVDNVLGEVFAVVCEANNKKPDDATTGKVEKGEEWEDPIFTITELVQWYTQKCKKGAH
jgi:hypothetical protein